MIWVLTPGGFEDFVEEASVPAETATVPPPSVLPPENVVEIVLHRESADALDRERVMQRLASRGGGI